MTISTQTHNGTGEDGEATKRASAVRGPVSDREPSRSNSGDDALDRIFFLSTKTASGSSLPRLGRSKPRNKTTSGQETLPALLAGSAFAADKTKPNLPRTDADISETIQQEMLFYPHYTIVDDIS